MIEELDSIKETVSHKPQQGEEGALETARPDSVPPLTTRLVSHKPQQGEEGALETARPDSVPPLTTRFVNPLLGVMCHFWDTSKLS